jgi:branched-chain amino acid transport system ATP-binding protein/urea transport system ATP-binding protein
MSAPLLEARGVGVRFGGLQALSGVDFALSERELVCIIGPNGAGKSTFLNVLTGTVRPTEGVVRFKGREIAALPVHRIARLGIARKFQVPSVFPSLTVGDNLRVAQWGAAGAPRPEREILDMTGLGPRAEELAATLSHGERQWLEIGMAIAAGPSLLLLDEPTAGMTPRETLATAEMLLRLRDQLAIVAVEHDISFVRALDVDTLVLHQGRTFRRGPFPTVEADEAVRDVYLGRR